MATKRTRIARDVRRVIGRAAIAAFERLRAASTEEEEVAAHSALHDLLGVPPWEWPCVANPHARCPYPAGCFAAQRWERERVEKPEPIALWIELARLVKAAAPRRTRTRRSTRNLSP